MESENAAAAVNPDIFNVHKQRERRVRGRGSRQTITKTVLLAVKCLPLLLQPALSSGVL